MKRAFLGPLALTAALASLAPSRAFAASPADQAAADALFQDGKRLAAAGDYAHACPKLAESNRLDPGAGTLLNLGDCYEKEGKLASAWATFNEASSMAANAGDTARSGEAARRAQELSARIPRLTIVVSPGARLPGLDVRRDGAGVGEGQWGTAVPVDPGEHTVSASATGRRPWQQRISSAGPTTTVTIPALEPLDAAVVPPTAAGPVVAPRSAQPEPVIDDAPHRFWGPRRVAGAAIGAVGVVGLITGGVLGGLALSKNSASKADCSPTNTNACNATGTSERSTAVSLGNGSTAALAIGGALVVTSIVLFATAPSAPKLEVRTTGTTWSLRTSF